MDDFGHALAYALATLAFLGHHAWLMCDAVFRTIYRLKVSGKNMLEWTTAAQAASSPTPGITALSRMMVGSTLLGVIALTIAIFRADTASIGITPFALAWLFAPACAYWLSLRPSQTDAEAIAPQDARALRIVARKTWRFFETFVTADDSMLPPDNFQEDPDPRIAHRTSPTNIGLYLLSVASAKEFGWLGLGDVVHRLEKTIETVRQMETYRGHLYNWYDTQTLMPLEQNTSRRSTVGIWPDISSLWRTIATNGSKEPDDNLHKLDGLSDVIGILEDGLTTIPDDRRQLRPLRKAIEIKLAAFRDRIGTARQTPELLPMRLIEFAVQATGIRDAVEEFQTALALPAGVQLLSWADTLQETIETHFRDGSMGHETQVKLRQRLDKLALEARALAAQMEFGFLLDPQRLLFSIGFRVHEAMRDESCYDMLASEARLGSFFAIAKGDLRTRHWFRLGRTGDGSSRRGGAGVLVGIDV